MFFCPVWEPESIFLKMKISVLFFSDCKNNSVTYKIPNDTVTI